MLSNRIHTYAILLATPFYRGVFSQQTATPPNIDNGWCYYCSDDTAPPLCTAQCTTAITSLCAGDLSQSQKATNQNCTLQYKPPVYPINRNGARPISVSSTTCTNYFNQILATCNANTGSPASPDQSFCTQSGGGGTYGWNDDGSVMNNRNGRYIITTATSTQCGQAEAAWFQATSVILWNNSWIGPNDQIVFSTAASAVSAPATAATALPSPNPECASDICNIFDAPYYAHSPVGPWPEGGANTLRHRIVYEGWSVDGGSTRLFNSLYDRCGVYPGNFQAYMNGTQRVADLNLQGPHHDLCWCVPEAVWDASVGIVVEPGAFCSSGTLLAGAVGGFLVVKVHDEF